MTDVRQWLDALDLGQYTETFAENRIDGAVLAHLTEHKIITTIIRHHTVPKRRPTSQ